MSKCFFTKQQKPSVIRWLDQQFEGSPCFPASCEDQQNIDSKVSKTHIKAYKKWRNTPHKRRHINDWIETWLTKEERARLIEHLEKLDNLEI